MYIFKYHPDNTIYRNGSYHSTYAEFIQANPDFPLVEGDYFEYSNDKFVKINSEGHDIVAQADDVLIAAINGLDDVQLTF